VRKHFVLFKAHMIVQKFRQPRHGFGFNRQFPGAQTLKILHGGANLGMLGKQAYDSGILIEPRVARIGSSTSSSSRKWMAPVLCQKATNFSACRCTAASRFSGAASAARRICKA
jgi:hypothetical protein